MYYLICFISVHALVCNLQTNKKYNEILYYISIVFIFLVFSLSTKNQDYDAYIEIFDDPYLYSEFGYAFLVEIIKSFDGTHRALLFSLGLLFVFTFLRIKKYNQNASLVLLLYIIFPLGIDVIQIRNTFATLLIINSIISIVEKQKLIGVIWATIALSFHYFSVVFIIVIIVAQFNRIRFYNFFVITVGIISIAFGGKVLNYAATLDFSRTAGAYISDTIKYSSFLIWGAWLFIDLIILNFFKKRVIISKIELNKNMRSLDFINLLSATLLASFAFVGFLLYMYEFNRLYRFVLVVKYIFISMIFSYLQKNEKTILVAYFLLSTLALGTYYHLELNFDAALFGL